MGKVEGITETVEKAKDKIKNRIKRLICCSVIWVIIALLCLIGGAVLLAYHAKYLGEDDKGLEKGLAYAGIGMLCLGFLLVFVAIVLIVVVKNIININRRKANWKPPVFPYGHAPYPQQKLPEAPPLQAHHDGSGVSASPVDVVIETSPQ